MAPRVLAPSRKCSKCGFEKPLTLDFFRGKRTKTLGLRFRSACRVCADHSAYEVRYERHKEKVLARIRADRKANPERYREWDRRSYLKNIDKKRAGKKRQWAICDRKAKAEKIRAWKTKNPDKVRAIWRRTYEKNKEKILQRGYRWVKENPLRVLANRDRRRARELGNGQHYTEDDVRSLLKTHGRVCFYCSTFLKIFHVDHFVPLARGGSNVPDNLRLSCPACNYSKAARLPWEWMPQKFIKPKTG